MNSLYKVDKLYKIYQKTRELVEEDFKSQKDFDHVNPFWKTILSKRSSFPSFNDTMSFLSNNSAFGLGKRTEGSSEQEKISYSDGLIATKNAVDKDILDKLSESMIGSPAFFANGGTVGSTSFNENIMSTSRLIQVIDTLLGKQDKIDILEIGAGWGACAYQLLQYYGERINSVSICDLHENLFLSSFYLQANYPDRAVNFIPDHEIQSAGSNSLNFCFPKRVENMDFKFDLVVNMISFQEMHLEIIDGYMKYIKGHLADHGILYSENGIAPTSKINLAEKASDYGYLSNFKVLSLRNGLRFTPHLFFGNKQEIVLGKRKNDQAQMKPEYLDAIFYLMNLRLDENIDGLRKDFLDGNNSKEQVDFMDLIYEFFSTIDIKIKRGSLKKIKELNEPVIYAFLMALFMISQKKYAKAIPFLVESEKVLNGAAKVNVLCYLGILDQSKRNEMLAKIKTIAPEMETTARSIFKYGKKSRIQITEKISRSLNIKVKRWLGYSAYRWSITPLILATRILNKLEGRITSMKLKTEIPYYLQ